MRPVPVSRRSADNSAVRLPVICASCEVIGSLLVILVILQTGLVDTDVVAAAVLGESWTGEQATRLLAGGWDLSAPSH